MLTLYGLEPPPTLPPVLRSLRQCFNPTRRVTGDIGSINDPGTRRQGRRPDHVSRMNYEEVAAYIDGISYKPNARLTAYPSPEYRGVFIRLELHVPDANEPEVSAWVKSETYIPDISPPESLPLLVASLIRQMEMHEVDEWLRHDGVPLNDPHPVSV